MAKTHQNAGTCRALHDYLSDRLSQTDRMYFEDHLGSCPTCSDEVAFWHEFSPELEDWKSSKSAPQITQGDIYRLVSDASAGKKPAPVLRPGLAWTAAGACAAALAVMFMVSQTGNPISPAPQLAARSENTAATSAQPSVVAPIDETTRQIFETEEGQTLTQQVADNTIGLASNSRLLSIGNETTPTYRLDRGTAAFRVAKRTSDQLFSVKVAAYRVEVLGTEFSVSFTGSQEILVAVRVGAVRVIGPQAQSWELGGGDHLSLGAGDILQEAATTDELQTIADLVYMPSDNEIKIEDEEENPKVARRVRRRIEKPSANVATEELATLKQWLAAGQTERALKETERYLAANPRSGQGWMLLGDCHRKQRNWPEAVAAYERTMSSSVTRLKSRATYQAANLYQQKLGQHKKAIELYEAYLKSPTATKSLRAVAKLNLAKSLIATGNQARAKTLLEQVVDSQKGSYLAKNASELLKTL